MATPARVVATPDTGLDAAPGEPLPEDRHSELRVMAEVPVPAVPAVRREGPRVSDVDVESMRE